MITHADLEIGLHRRDVDSYRVELRFSQPESDAEVWPTQQRLSSVRFDLNQLRGLAFDDAAYGHYLSESLFAGAEVRTAFAQARSAAQTQDVPLRLRLFIGPSAPELHSLRWETLRDPQEGSPLLTGENILFSRYLSSLDWRPVRPRPQAALRALVVIANPIDLADYQPGGRPLAPLNVPDELAQARSGLRSISVTALDSGGSANLNNITAHLRDGYDILYLVCHGALIEGIPHLWLENESGKVAVVAGSELVTRFRELRQWPQLVVLASCQSAGTGDEARSGDEGALAALGPRLAEAGIPAVLAMQGNISMQTAAQFMPVFFRELQHKGQIDRAATVARGVVRERHDWWVPVLFMRLKSGRIWYKPGFGDGERVLERWPALLEQISMGYCTPILGPGLTESLLGTRREISRRWAETYHFPMAPHDRENLTQVAQYLAVDQGDLFPRARLANYLRQEILDRYGEHLPDELHEASLDELISAVGKFRRERDQSEPHQVLAQLGLPIYITTDPSNLLAEALIAAGKDPQVVLCPWNKDPVPPPSVYKDEPGFRPDAQRPLIYHLFGRLDQPFSVVLTEDNYFDFLIGVTRDKDLIPGVVRRALTDAALLFLGFRMEDWDFRVLFRSIMGQEGRHRLSRYAHVAVQIDPEEGRILEPERARRYLESFFKGADISIYWGSTEDFIKDLKERWEGGAR